MMKKKRAGVFDALADKTKGPDVLGFQPIDPKKWEAVKRLLGGRQS